jgi:hypothetical protein
MKNENAAKVTPNFGKKTAPARADTENVGDADATFIESKVGMTIAVGLQDRDEHFTILDLKAAISRSARKMDIILDARDVRYPGLLREVMRIKKA